MCRHARTLPPSSRLWRTGAVGRPVTTAGHLTQGGGAEAAARVRTANLARVEALGVAGDRDERGVRHRAQALTRSRQPPLMRR